MLDVNLMESKISLQLSVCFFHGINDYTCSFELVKEYFNIIRSPLKGFYTFNKSAQPIIGRTYENE